MDFFCWILEGGILFNFFSCRKEEIILNVEIMFKFVMFFVSFFSLFLLNFIFVLGYDL